MPKESYYSRLAKKMKPVTLLETIELLLDWDEKVIMPSEDAAHRSEQLAFISGLKHQRLIEEENGDLLKEAAEELKDKCPLSPEMVNVREWKRDYDKATKLPTSLVEEQSRAHSKAHQVWLESRKTGDYKTFAPHLDKVFQLALEVAECYGYDEDPYDALLDIYEPGLKSAVMLEMLRSLRSSLVPLLDKIMASERQPDTSVLHGNYPAADQEALGKQASEAIGFRYNHGRLDVTAHPFCTTIGPRDIRICTRYDESIFTSGFLAILHEAGHGMYEQNVSQEHWGTPMGLYRSLGIHESQSLFWENHVARSEGFWRYWLPKTMEKFNSLQNVKFDDFYFAINKVQPSFIRVDADELTYNLHILLRAELEYALLHGKMKAADMADAWNDLFKEYFGLKVPDNNKGCLQDIHWSIGAVGYFPTYSLGTIYAAQLYDAVGKQVGKLEALFSKGDYAPVREWLVEKIHKQGRRYMPAELIENATGSLPDPSFLIKYLENKYQYLYGI